MNILENFIYFKDGIINKIQIQNVLTNLISNTIHVIGKNEDKVQIILEKEGRAHLIKLLLVMIEKAFLSRILKEYLSHYTPPKKLELE